MELAVGSMDLVKAQRAIIGMLKTKGVPAKLAVQQSEDILQDCVLDCLEKDIPLTYGILRIGVMHNAQDIARSKEKKSIYGADGSQNVDAVSRKDSTFGQAVLNEAISNLGKDAIWSYQDIKAMKLLKQWGYQPQRFAVELNK
jgi:hypothetical protein